MFVTTPELERWVPPGISEPGEKYWEAFMFVLDLPWYVLTIWRRDGSVRTEQTIAVATELTLRHIVEGAEPGCVATLSRVGRVKGGATRWEMQGISEIWIPSEQEAPDSGPLLFSLVDRQGVFDSHGTLVSPEAGGRSLLVRLNPQPA